MTTNSFGADGTTNPDPTGTSPSTPPVDDNVEILKKRLKDKDDFIETLKSETKELRDIRSQLETQLQQARTIDELMERVKEYEPSHSSDPTGPRLDEDNLLTKLEERVFNKLSQKQREELETQNWRTTVASLQEKYGEKYTDYVRQRAEELSIPIAEMDRLAKTSPKALLELVTGQQQRATMQPTTPTQRTPQGTTTTGQQNDEYFERINRLRFVKGTEGDEARRVFNSKDYQAQWRKKILDKAQSN